MKKAQGSGYVAGLAGATLGAMAQSDAVRSVILHGQGTKPIVLMLARTNLALPGTLFCDAFFIFIFSFFKMEKLCPFKASFW